MSRENERPGHPGHHANANANVNILRTSNATSEHFLGSTPRGWMLDQRGVINAATPLQNVRPQNLSRNSVQTRPASTGSASSLQVVTPSGTVDLDGAYIVPTNYQVNVPSNVRQHGHISAASSNTFAAQSNGRQVAAAQGTHPNTAYYGVPQSSGGGMGTVAMEGVVATSPVFASPPLQPVPARNTNDWLSMSAIHLAAQPTRPQMGIQRQSLVDVTAQAARLQSAPNHSSTTLPSPATTPVVASSHLPPNLISAVRSRDQHEMPQAPTVGQPQTPIVNQPMAGGLSTSVQPGAVPEQNLEPILDQRISVITATSPLSTVDHIRLTWLRGACRHGDTFYLFLHQLSCIHTAYPQFVASRLGFSSKQIEGLILLNQVLADNKEVNPNLMLVFCSFIAPLQGFELDEGVQLRLPKTKAFLEQFRARWEGLRDKVFARGVPPFAYELAAALSADSHILSQAVYTNFFYQLFPRAVKLFTEQAFNIFKQSQAQFFHRMSEGFRWTAQSYEQDLRAFVANFHDLLQKHGQRPLTIFAPLQPEPSRGSAALPVSTAQNPTTNETSTFQNNSVGQNLAALTNRSNIRAAHNPLNRSLGSRQGVTEIQQNIATPLFPKEGFVLPTSREPDPSRSALHQAHLQNPVISVEDATITSDPIPRFYSFLECFVGKPKFIDKHTVFEEWLVTIPPEMFNRRARDVPVPKEDLLSRPNRLIKNGSVIFHLRCIEVGTVTETLDESEVSATRTTWPEHLFVSVNGTHLDFRRKIHFGRDQPVDVTALVQEEANEFKLSYLLNKENQKEVKRTFALVLEANNVLEHEKALELPGRIDANASLSAITRLLRTHEDNDDDEISLVNAHISIDLIDPNTLRIFDRPVRGRTCDHRECFDLETFLRERPMRHKDGLVQPDEWVCQLCKKDARPGSLIVDEFLLQVKEKLIADGNGDAKAVLVKEDGSWEAKTDNIRTTNPSNMNGSNEPRSARSTSATDAKAGLGPPRELNLNPSPLGNGEHEVIVLDDD